MSPRSSKSFFVASSLLVLVALAHGVLARQRRQSEHGIDCFIQVNGESGSVPCSLAEFGPVNAVEGRLLHAAPAVGCDAAAYGPDTSRAGAVAVATRGECSFQTKAAAAQAAGAAGLVVVDTETGALPILGAEPSGPRVNITTVIMPSFISKVLRASIGGDEDRASLKPRTWLQRPRRLRSTEERQTVDCKPSDKLLALAVANAGTPRAAINNLVASASASRVPLRVVGGDVPDAGWATHALVLLDAVQQLLYDKTLGERDIVMAVPADASLIVGGIEDIVTQYCSARHPVLVAGRRDCEGCTDEVLQSYPVGDGPLAYGGLREGLIGMAGEIERMLLEMGFRTGGNASMDALHSYLHFHKDDEHAVVDSYGTIFHPLNRKWGSRRNRPASINDFFFAQHTTGNVSVARWGSLDTGFAPSVLVGNGGRQLGAGALVKLAKKLPFPVLADPWSRDSAVGMWVGSGLDRAEIALAEQQRLVDAVTTTPALLRRLAVVKAGVPLDALRRFPSHAREHEINEKERFALAVFSDVKRLPSWPYLTGDTLRAWCTHYVHEHNAAEWRDRTWVDANVKANAIIFLPVKFIKAFEKGPARWLTQPFTLVTHNTRNGVPGTNSKGKKLLKSELLRAWWTVNPSIEHPKLFALPMGLPNRYHADKGSIRTLDRARAGQWTVGSDKRANFVYVNYRSGDNKLRQAIRKHFKDMDGAKVVSKVHGVAYSKYAADLCDSQYVVCPPPTDAAAATDSYCPWEALACGAIPIMPTESGPAHPNSTLLQTTPVYRLDAETGWRVEPAQLREYLAVAKAMAKSREFDVSELFATTWVKRIAAYAAPGAPLPGSNVAAVGEDLSGLHRVRLLPGSLAWEHAPAWLRDRPSDTQHEAASKKSSETAEVAACAAAAQLRYEGKISDAHSLLRTALFAAESRRAPLGECKRKLGSAGGAALAAGDATCAVNSPNLCLHAALGDLLASMGRSVDALGHWRYALHRAHRLGAPQLVAGHRAAREVSDFVSAVDARLAAFGPLAAALAGNATNEVLRRQDVADATVAVAAVAVDGQAKMDASLNEVKFLTVQQHRAQTTEWTSNDVAIAVDLADAVGTAGIVISNASPVPAELEGLGLAVVSSEALAPDIAPAFAAVSKLADAYNSAQLDVEEVALIEAVRAVAALDGYFKAKNEECGAGDSRCSHATHGVVLQFLVDKTATTATCARTGADKLVTGGAQIAVARAGGALCLYVRSAEAASRLAHHFLVDGAMYRPGELLQIVGHHSVGARQQRASASDAVIALLLRLDEAMPEGAVRFVGRGQ